ncbi:hypothetical protein Mal15_38270 [Stieleria maiorica]|uniref:Uncharacterized protein n=1 Tax=Stieleria maiorica TaxID=2795974 RepID=A0A5B9MII0_9BACT|nr:hypothetical protein [Stieleria maiorica]QEF99760.1 hypothetical protein Mal15_38270 [Stieleria maiorica]
MMPRLLLTLTVLSAALGLSPTVSAQAPEGLSAINRKLDAILSKLEDFERRMQALEARSRIGEAIGVVTPAAEPAGHRVRIPYFSAPDQGMMIDMLERKARYQLRPKWNAPFHEHPPERIVEPKIFGF